MIFLTPRTRSRPSGAMSYDRRPMRRLALAVLGALAMASPAAAHPAPFSYVDLVLRERALDVTVVAHVFDVAHDLGLRVPVRAPRSGRWLTPRGDARRLPPRRPLRGGGGRSPRSPAARRPRRRSWPRRARSASRFTCATERPPGLVRLRAVLFPYDPVHQTFVNVYEGGELQAQAVLDKDHPASSTSRARGRAAWAVVARFLPAGVHHILIGPDHLLFLVGLLLLGGSLRQLAVVVTAFTLAHSLTLTLAVLGIVSPPARLVEPAIALSIVYVGADNLLVKSGRDMRPWIALVFGLVHGLGFASVLREMDLPRRALGWSLFSFNLGVEIGQLVGGAGGGLRPGRPESAQRAGAAPPGRDRFGRRRGRGAGLVRATAVFPVALRHRRAPGGRHESNDRPRHVDGVRRRRARRLRLPGLPSPSPQAKVVEVEKVKDNLFLLKGGGGNTAVFVGTSGVVVVDTKLPGWGQPILDKIKELTDKPVTTIINTHTHGDHVSGNVEFPATVDVVTHENTKANMDEDGVAPRHSRPRPPRASSRPAAARGCPSGPSRTRSPSTRARTGSTSTTSAAGTPTETPSSSSPPCASCTRATSSRARARPSWTPTTAAAASPSETRWPRRRRA